MHRASQHCLFALFLLLPLLAAGQTLNIANDVQTAATLTNTTATLTGKAELHITGTGDPIPGCVIHLNSPDAWFFMRNIVPSVVASTFVSRVRVNGANAVLDANVRIVQHELGTVVIPHGPDFAPMEVFDGKFFAGPSKPLRQYLEYNDLTLGTMKTAISSFRLKRGYMATVAQNENGTGISKCYVAQDGDLEVGALPSNLDNSIRFVRIFPWRWVSKKGIAGNIEQYLNIRWLYNWNLDRVSPLNWEYVPIRHTRYWPGLDQDWKYRGATHLLGYNEPDHADQANMTVAEAIASWPDLLATGLRLGAPAITDGGKWWITDFMNQANAAGLRVDFVPVHYYRSHSNAGDAAGAASQFYNFLKDIYDTVQRPLWVTEYNNGANWTTGPDPTFAQQAATVAAMNDMLDSAPFVERYAIYNWVEDVRRVVWDDNWPTDAGAVYRDNASPNAMLQELPNAGTAAAAHYSFNGDTRDSSGNGHDATPVGAPIFTTGKYGQSVSLDGATDYLQLSPRLGDSTDFSFAGWVFWNGGGNWQRIFDFGDGTERYLCLIPKSGSNTLRFVIRKDGTEQQLNGTVLPTGVWTHVAVTLSGDTGKLFVNGALVNTNAAMTINPADIGTRFNYLGESQFTADPRLNARLDDVRVFSTALSDAQVAAIAANAPPQFNATLIATSATKLVPFTGSIFGNVSGGNGAVTFSKMSGPGWLAVAANGSLTGVPGLADGGVNRFIVRALDASGALSTATLEITVADAAGLVTRYAFDGTANATAGTAHGVASGSPPYAAGKYGSAIDLNGTDDFVTLAARVVSHADLTIAAWVYWDGGANWQRLFDFGNGTGEYLLLSPKSGSNTMRFEIKNNGAAQILETAPLATAQWIHVAVTLGAGTGRLYVNGVQADSDAITIKPTDFEPVANFIGKSQFAADPLFNGRVDEFVIFNQALSAAQIAALAGARAPVFSADPITKPVATAGQNYEQSIGGTATDPDAGTTLIYSKVSGPAWLTVAANGRISGVPAASDAGTNRFIVRATDPTLLSDDTTLDIVVPTPSGLIAHFQLDANTANTVGGAAGVTSGAPVYQAGLFDRAIRLDGADDFVTLPAGLVSSLTDATFATRFRWDGGGAWQRIFDFGNSTSNFLALAFSSTSGTLHFTIRTSSANAQALNGPQIAPGDWTHAAITLIGSTGTLYVNGAAVATGTITHDPANIAPALNYLGKSQYTADPLFDGTLDDFRIYNRGLTPAEIATLAIPPAAITVPDSSYAGWAAGYTFPGGQSGMLQDADNDGLTNAWEYLTGTHPTLASSGTTFPTQIMTAAALGLGNTGKTYLTLQARIRKIHLGASFIAEAAATLPGLALPTAATQALPAGAPIPDGTFEIHTYYYDTPLEDSPGGTGFIRLRAALE